MYWRQSYTSSFEIKNLRIAHLLLPWQPVNGGVRGWKHDQRGKFLKISFWFKSDDAKIWLEYMMGRYLEKLKKNDDVISDSNIWRHNHHFDVMTTREVESPYCFFVFVWIKLEFGVRGNFRFLISNLNSKTQYQFEILRKCHFSSLRSWFLAQRSLMNWLPWQQWMTYLLISKTFIYDYLKKT